MFPQVLDGRVDQLLSTVILAYRNKTMISDQILPTVPNLAEDSGLIPRLGNSHLRQYSSKRSLYDTSEHRIEFTIDKDLSYKIDYYDMDIYVPDRLSKQLKKTWNAHQAAQITVMDAMLLEREIGLAALMTSTAVITNNTTLSGTSQYTDRTNSTPEDDIDTAMDSVYDNTASEANAIYMSHKVMNALRKHPWFLDISQSALQGNGNKATSLSKSAFIQTLKDWFEFEFVFIGRSIKISSKEGQTETKDNVWGDDIVVFTRPAAPSLFTPSFGYSFQLAGMSRRTIIRREPLRNKGDLVEVDWAYQDKILDTNAGYLIKDAI